MPSLNALKPIALTVLMLIAFALTHGAAQAGERQSLIVAGGCFWCVESDFESVPGVVNAVSGYTGGKTDNPSYKQVTKGGSGHYEAVRIEFDPTAVTRETLMSMFIRSIDPTDAGGQFCDRGDSYRSAIFVSNPRERALAQQVKTKAQADLGQTIVTPILNAATFYPAEAYHQDYYKGTKLVLTRFGPRKQSTAYKLYRKACGRDQRVNQLWGKAALTPGS